MPQEIDWSSLRHAYGPATDTPGHLAALTSADVAARRAAFYHLDTAVLHQGFPCSATAPATRVVTGLLARGAIAAQDRAEVLEFLGAVAEAAVLAGENSFFAELVMPLRQAVEESYPVVAGFLDDVDPAVARCAAEAAVSHVRTPALAGQRAALAARLRVRADDPAADRPFWVGLLGEVGGPVGAHLTDSDPGVRVRAALAPGLAGDETATTVVVAALTEAAEHGIAEHAGYWLGELVGAALARVDDFERIATAAEAIVRHANWTGFETTWGPLLLAAFRTPYDEGTGLSATQRRILAAAVANDRLWNPSSGNSSLVFRRAGLPFDREACARIVG